MRTIGLIFLISIFGLLLRIWDYEKVPPSNENFDEVHYAWGGGTWIKEGVFRSWSYYNSYQKFTYIERFGNKWKIVEPLVEKPPLYFLLSGAVVTIFGPPNVFDVSHSIIRILPLLLSLASIFLTGLLALRVFGRSVAVISALSYATIPTIVMANRLSVTESLVTPLMLGVGVLLTYTFKNSKHQLFKIIGISFLVFLSTLTKQVGVVVGIGAGIFYLSQRRYREVLLVATGLVLGLGVFVLIGALYDFSLFLSVANDLKVRTLGGLPETIASIFMYPGIGAKNRPFLDGAILLGLILLFASPFMLKQEIIDKDKNIFAFLVLPLTFIAAIALGESGAGPFSYFAIYIFPLFPFAAILLSKFMVDVWKDKYLLGFLILVIVLGSSSIRFLFMNFPREYQYLWQNLFILLFAASFILYFLLGKLWKMFLVVLFSVFILVNVFTVLNLNKTYEAQVKQVQSIDDAFTK